jgi:hypothetical protein
VSPASAKRFGQAFLTLDAWCESARGRWGNKSPKIGGKRMEIGGKEIRVSSSDSADELRYTNKKLGGEKGKNEYKKK